MTYHIMLPRTLPLLTLLATLAAAQTPGTGEVRPELTTYKCTLSGGCTKQTSLVVLDSAHHGIVSVSDGVTACGNSSYPNTDVCTDKASCATNCVIKGLSDYSTSGVSTNGSSLSLSMLKPDGSVSSPRMYLLEPNGEKYEMLQLTGNEFTFDVDVSKLPCGTNGALYLSEMAADGGKSDLNPAGAAWGTGYCDAQCSAMAFVNGTGNFEGIGLCCNEMDIWEANSRSTHLAPHTCNIQGLYGCTGDECGRSDAGVCDKSGCSQNPYTLGSHDYYGLNGTVDTTRPFTVVTQFPSNANGTLNAIRRLYVQDNQVIQTVDVNITGYAEPQAAMTDAYCDASGAATFDRLGGIEGMGNALSRGMVLVFSLWWDYSGNMTWLNSGSAGPCSSSESNPASIVLAEPNPAVVFSEVKWGEIGSTFASGLPSTNATALSDSNYPQA